ncbi:MAG: HAD family hydrolase [Clostridia bacterium]|nr:HAD family hydrolase [Clostridia bacterium]
MSTAPADKSSWSLEIINNVPADRVFKAALFDFDGTLSLIREGWQEIMIPYFCEEFNSSVPNKTESDDEVIELITDFVDELTGKQTIFQCLQLKIEIEKRGGHAKDAMEYKNEYLRRLFLRIEDKRNGLSDGSIKPEELLVKGAAEFLSALKNEGIELLCASGTDQPQVIEEAKLLGLDKYFGNNIFGALDEHAQQCSKEVVIQRLLTENNIKGENLLSFGDGFVEIELVNKVGGYTVAVATDEKHQCGVNEYKRKKLLSAGADAVIPDFENTEQLIAHLFNKEEK